MHPFNTFYTSWPRQKVTVIFQTTFSYAFSWMEMYKFLLRFHWSLFPRTQLPISIFPITNILFPIMAWRRPGLVYWRIYASLSLNELKLVPSVHDYHWSILTYCYYWSLFMLSLLLIWHANFQAYKDLKVYRGRRTLNDLHCLWYLSAVAICHPLPRNSVYA